MSGRQFGLSGRTVIQVSDVRFKTDGSVWRQRSAMYRHGNDAVRIALLQFVGFHCRIRTVWTLLSREVFKQYAALHFGLFHVYIAVVLANRVA